MVVPQIWGTIVSLLVIFFAWVATNQAYLFTFYGFNANREYQTIGYYLFNMVQDGRFTSSALEQNYRKASALGLMLTLIVAPVTILVTQPYVEVRTERGLRGRRHMAQTKLKTPGKRKLSVFELIVMVLLIAYCVAVVALLVWGFMGLIPYRSIGGATSVGDV